MGLLDNIANAPADSGVNEALLAVSNALLTPRARGGGFGAAFGAIPQAVQMAQQNAMRKRLMGLQEQQVGLQGQELQYKLSEAQRKAAEDAQRKAVLEKYIATLPPEQQALARIAPTDYLKSLTEQKVVSPGGAIVQGGKPVYQAPFKPDAPSPVAALLKERDALAPDSPLRSVYDAAISKATTHAPPIQNRVEFKQEGEEAKTVGKYFGTQYADIQKAGIDAYGKVNRLTRLENLLSNIETGKLTPAATEVKSALAALGINIDPNLGSAQAAQAISNELALQMRNPSGGAGMPGALSDRDLQFLQATVPNLSKTPEGNRLLIQSYKKMAQREQDVAKLAREYRTKHGTLDEGFYQQLQEFADKNPLFADVGQASGTPAGWSVKRIK